MNTKKILLILAAILIAIGIVKPDISKIIPVNNINNNSISLVAPDDDVVKQQADIIVDLLKNADTKDTYRLRDLALDLATLIKLDGEDLVIKTTNEIRQANSISGVMLKLDMKGKYPSLSQASNSLIVACIGDDDVNLTPELREQAVKAFLALAWAYNGGK